MATLAATTYATFAAGHAGNIGNIEGLDASHNNTDFSLSTQSVTEYTHSRITITPSVATSRIWICYAMQAHINMLTHTSARTCKAKLHRYIGSTDTDIDGILSMRVMLAQNDYEENSSVIGRIDHPNTTSAVRYSMYMQADDSSIVYWQHNFAASHGLRGFAMELIGTPVTWER